ncbi:MAG: peptidoglycan-binding LysM, partial [Bacteroidetes bacterium]|nr:peptidoglycan-binding LysM [Bacteroidota bacterium]
MRSTERSGSGEAAWSFGAWEMMPTRCTTRSCWAGGTRRTSAGGGTSTRWKEAVGGTTTPILDDTVSVGARRFRVANPATHAPGDNIILYHPCTDSWLQAIDYGGSHYTEPAAEPGVDVPWEVDSQPILYNRFITAVRGDTISIDAPVFNPLVKALSPAYIYTYARTGLLTNIGIERLRIDIETAEGT